MRIRSVVSSFVLALGLGSASCSHPADKGPPPSSSPAAAAPEAKIAPAQADPIYRVPVDDLPSFGNERALVTLVAFTDYQCPFCRKADATVTKLREKYGDDLRVVIAERPLMFHDKAKPAAFAALAAASQGRFEAMHTRLFSVTEKLDDAVIAAAARESGLDMARFEVDRASESNAKAIAKLDELAGRLGVRGTPTFFVNGRKVVGNQPIDVFENVIDERLAAARALVQSGVRPGRVYEATIADGLEKDTEAPGDTGAACNGEPSCKHAHETAAVDDVVEKVPTEGAPARGPADAPITIVAFSDFECPYCAHAVASVHALEAAHPGRVRVVFKQRPLPFHEHARLAAKASLAAAAQGRFWQYHDALYENQKSLDRASLEARARDVGLDVARFSRDLDDPALDKRIDADIADATALHVDGTPTFFVNGRRVVGAQGALAFEAAIAKH